MLVKRFVNKMQNRFNEQYQSQQKSYKEEGKVTIDKTTKTTKTKSESVGEYVDFEEVE